MMRSVLCLLGGVAVAAAETAFDFTLPGGALWPTEADWRDVKGQLAGDVFVRGEEGYDLDDLYSLGMFNKRLGRPEPACIAYVETGEDMQAMVKFAKQHHMRVSVLNTGHNADARNTADNSVMIFPKRMKTVVVDLSTPAVTFAGGTRFDDIAPVVDEVSNSELVALTGACKTVGAWGWHVGGGTSFLSGQYGLGADQIISATVVTGNGDIVTASETENTDLFWALKGGSGPAFGVGVNMTVKLVPRPKVLHTFIGLYAATDSTAEKFSEMIEDEPDNAASYYFSFLPGLITTLSFCADDGCDAYIEKAQAIPCAGVGIPGSCERQELSYPFDYYDLLSGIMSFTRVEHVTAGLTFGSNFTTTLKGINEWMSTDESGSLLKNCYVETIIGNAVKTIDPNGTQSAVAPGFRKADAYVVCVIQWEYSLAYDTQLALMDSVKAFDKKYMEPYSPEGWLYWNDAGHRVDNWRERYWGPTNYDTLAGIKSKYDEDGILSCFHCVGWDFNQSVDPVLCPENNCTCTNNPHGTCNYYADPDVWANETS